MMPTKHNLIRAISRSLRDFGYPDATYDKVEDCWNAYAAGGDMPHEVIGMFAERQLDEIAAARPDILTRAERAEQNEAKTRTAATTVNSTVNSENALDDESEKT